MATEATVGLRQDPDSAAHNQTGRFCQVAQHNSEAGENENESGPAGI